MIKNIYVHSCLKPCSNHKIHVLFDLKILKLSTVMIAYRYTDNIAAQTDHFADFFFRINVVRGYDVLTTFNRSNFRNKNRCDCFWNRVKYARITIAPVLFCFMHRHGSCLNTCPLGSCIVNFRFFATNLINSIIQEH